MEATTAERELTGDDRSDMVFQAQPFSDVSDDDQPLLCVSCRGNVGNFSVLVQGVVVQGLGLVLGLGRHN